MSTDPTGFGPAEWPTLAQARQQIRARNAALGALILDSSQQAVQRAAGLRDDLPLSRVPYSLKDVWDTRDTPTTAGCIEFRTRQPKTDCAVVRALVASGAVCIGKSNVPDLAATPECASSAFGRSKNPHDEARTPGGSSGGAAAAVASGMAAFDWGSDFGGSIRLPAAFCGVVGLRLSSQTWPVSGHFPFVPPDLGLQGHGPLARSVRGVRAVRDALAPALKTKSGGPFELRGVVVLGVDAFSAGQWPYAEREISEALADQYVRRQSAELPSPRAIHHAFAALLANHWRRIFGAHVSGGSVGAITRGTWRLHPHTRRIIAELALANLSLYRDAERTQRAVTEVRRLCAAAFAQGYLIASPTTTHPAPLHDGAHGIRSLGVFAKLGNLLDATALALPFGNFASGMPRSLQLLGPAEAEECVLTLGEQLERAFTKR
jgi:Asp-tRNA(Asn)/Glu-tRNA(Gln) amidotransferase A subunit family amidase